MVKILPFVTVTKRSIMRKGKQELLHTYQISAGGIDPVVDFRAWEEFEMGLIDEMPWASFADLVFEMYREEGSDK